MTDEQIIKAFEVCRGKDLCNECAYAEDIDCLRRREKDAIDLMKRQMAEIEEKSNKLREILPIVAELKAEAVKEFAERLHKGIDDFRDKREMVMLPYTESALLIIERKIDLIAKEMVGEQK